MTSRKTQVLVADDSALMRKIISEIIAQQDDMEVCGTAIDGEFAVKKAALLKPDVITLDVEMPRLDGLSALRAIMRDSPTPVIMVSSYTTEGAATTIEALENGALDFVTKPGGPISLNLQDVAELLVAKIRLAARVPVDKLAAGGGLAASRPVAAAPAPVRPDLKWIVALGISTGGPNALGQLFAALDPALPAGYLVVQHMPPGFTATLAQRLDSQSPLTVKEAASGDRLRSGLVLLAPGDWHMRLAQEGREYMVTLDQESPVAGHRPSADVLFSSVAEARGARILGLIMTGMGHDGAEGIGRLQKAGGTAWGQSEKSCVVFGMPRVAKEHGHVSDLVDLADLPRRIARLISAS